MLLTYLESKIRKIPKLYLLLRPIIPYLNIFFTVERDFKALKYLPKDYQEGIAIDIGFNDGLSSISILRNSSYRIIGFEPLPVRIPIVVRFLTRNVERHQIGLGRSKDVLNIYTPVFMSKEMSPYSSLSEEAAVMNFQRDSGLRNNAVSTVSRKIIIDSLDSFNLRPAFIKIDTEGTELEVLKGATQTLLNSSPFVLVEIPDEKNFLEVTEYMAKLNYAAHTFSNGTFSHALKYLSYTRNYWLIPKKCLHFNLNS